MVLGFEEDALATGHPHLPIDRGSGAGRSKVAYVELQELLARVAVGRLSSRVGLHDRPVGGSNEEHGVAGLGPQETVPGECFLDQLVFRDIVIDGNDQARGQTVDVVGAPAREVLIAVVRDRVALRDARLPDAPQDIEETELYNAGKSLCHRPSDHRLRGGPLEARGGWVEVADDEIVAAGDGLVDDNAAVEVVDQLAIACLAFAWRGTIHGRRAARDLG